MFLKILQNLQEHTCASAKKETLAQIFSCEICEISNNTFLTEHVRVSTSQSVLDKDTSNM